MKAFKLIAVGLLLVFASTASAQISVNVNIGNPPSWGPCGYDNARYYYLPDVESYYDVQNSRFIYYTGNSWVRSVYLPQRYRNYDLHRGYKVVMTDYRGNTPYTHFSEHKGKYKRGYRGVPQVSYRDYKNNKNDHKGSLEQKRPDNRQSQHGNQKKGDNKHHDNNGKKH